MVSGEQKLLAVLAHVSYLAGGIGFITAPLLILLLKKDDHFVYHHARQSLIAHLAILALSVITGLLSFILIGLFLLPFLAIFLLILFVASLFAAYRAANGEFFDYPMIQWLTKKFE